MANTRYVTPSAPVADNNPTATAAANATALAGGQFSIGSPTPPAATPPAPTPPPTTTATETGVNGATPTDPVAAYYAGLADPSVTDQPIKDQIQSNMQSALDAIDQKYVSTYAQNTVDNANRSGQTRAENSRSGLNGSDFGNANTQKTVAVNNASTAAIDNAKAAEKSTVQTNASNALLTLAENETAAKKADALGQAQNAQKLMDDNQTQARALIPTIAASGAALTDAQKQALQRNSGYDDLTFDSIYNSSKAKADQIDYKSEVIKNGDGSSTLLMYGLDPTTNQLVTQKYNVPDNTANVQVYGGRPYTQTTDANGAIHLTPVQGFVSPTAASDSATAQTTAFNLKVKQAPAQVAVLAAQGYGWDQIASYFTSQGIDPGSADVDDALHRQFSSQADYATWKQQQTAASKTNAQDILLQTLTGGSGN